MRRRYHILDVFTDTKLAGNPLAVVLDSDGLDDAAMQRIAREFNLSETVFCSAPSDPVNTAALRIFTPAAELPFAGHPTIGTAVLLGIEQAPDLIAREDVGLVLEEKVGAISCSVRRRRGEAAHARFEAPRAAESWAAPPDPAAIAAQLGLARDEIGFDGHLPSCFSAGNAMTFVPIASLEALGRATLQASPEKTMVYVYARAEPQGKTPTYRSRMLSTGYGIDEDPATGSAAAAFPGALANSEPLADGEHDLILLQGIEMGRPSRIGVAFAVEGGRAGPATIGGSAVVVMQGHLDLLSSRLPEVATLDFPIEPYEWAFSRDETARIDAHWAQVLADKPRMFDGRVLLAHRWEISGDRLVGACFEIGFKSFLSWRDFGFPGVRVFNIFSMPALRAADGAFMLGEMSAGTSNAGKLYFPAGTPDLSDIGRDGSVDFEGSILRELEEETGLAPHEVELEATWRIVVAPRPAVACMRVARSPLSVEALQARLDAHNAGIANPELVRLVPVRSLADLDRERMPDFMLAYLTDALSGR